MKKALLATLLAIGSTGAFAQSHWDRSYICNENTAEPYILTMSNYSTQIKQRYLSQNYTFHMTLKEAVGTKWIYSSPTGAVESIATFYVDGTIMFREKITTFATTTTICR